MKPPCYYAQMAKECRLQALGLNFFGLACLGALALIGSSLAGTALWWIPLALVAGALASVLAAALEIAEARRFRRLARMEETFQPFERL